MDTRSDRRRRTPSGGRNADEPSVAEAHIPVRFRGPKTYAYSLLKKLAAGGMGEVWFALQNPVGNAENAAASAPAPDDPAERLVAIKRLLPHYNDSEPHVGTFDEARVSLRLDHPNIVRMLDLGEQDDLLFICFELVHGLSLNDILDHCYAKKTPLPISVVVEIVRQTCRGQATRTISSTKTARPSTSCTATSTSRTSCCRWHRETHRLWHRAREISQGFTETGAVKGKFAYLSPEQGASQPLTAAGRLFVGHFALRAAHRTKPV